jgi:hypothetical protein
VGYEKILLLVVFLLIPEIAKAADMIQARLLQSGFFNIYAPTHVDNDLLVGGWPTENDIGADKIYRLQSSQLLVPAFAKPGFHVNDPSVIRHPDYGWYFMYYTALPNSYATASEMTRHNYIGFASSVGGVNWTDHGVILDQWNGLDNFGAWSPAAMVVGREIWLYFHANAPGTMVYRARLNINGWQLLETSYVQFPHFTFMRTNVHVFQRNGGFEMLANSSDLKQIWRYVSQDGIRWVDADAGKPIVDASKTSALVLTPYGVPVGNNLVDVYFGWAGNGSTSDSLHVWTITDSAPVVGPVS